MEFLLVPEPVWRGGDVYHYKLQGRRLTGSCLGFATFQNTRTSKAYCYKSAGRAWSLYGGDSWKNDHSHLASLNASPTDCVRRSRKLGIFPSPRAFIEEELEFF